jgi:uncharacterized protein YodC (DUF2158 family)
MHEGTFRVTDLALVSRSTPLALQPRRLGQRVRLNSGGPDMLVVEIGYGGGMVTAAYSDGEITVQAACLQGI